MITNQVDLNLLYIGLLLVTVKVVEDIFERIKLPPIVGAILAGVLLGGSALKLVATTSAISVMVQLGVIMMLFLAGADEFDLGAGEFSRKRGRFVAGVTVGWLGPTIVLVASLYWILHLNTAESLFAGVVLGMSSVAPLTRVLMDLNISKTLTAVNSFTFSLYIEVFGIIAAAVSLEYGASRSAALLPAIETVGGIVLLISVLYVLRQWVPAGIKFIEKSVNSREASFALMVAAVLIMGYLGTVARFNDAMVALFVGVAFSKYISERPNLLERLHAFTFGFFEPLFFGGLGLLINVSVLTTSLGTLLLVVILTFSSKMGFGYLGGMIRSARHPGINAAASSLKGGVDGALLLAGLAAGVISSLLYSVALVAIMLQLVIGSLILKALKGRISDQIKPDSEVTLTHSYIKWLAQGVPSIKIAQMLPDVILREDDTVSTGIQEMSRLNIPAAVIVNQEGRPMGSVTLASLAEVPKTKHNVKTLGEVMRPDVASVSADTPAWELLDIFSATGLPVVAVVDSEGRAIGTASEREFLLYLTAASSSE